MNTAKQNIYLVGMMGAGKTSVGRQLAKRLSRRFVDADQEIEERTGVRIPYIFELEGEAGFRQRESQVIEALSKEFGLVLATGGGAVIKPENRHCMASTGTVIYLRVPPLILFERTRHDRNRPLLQVADPLKKITELYALRDPLYLEIADVIVDGGTSSVAALAKRVDQEIRNQCKL